MYILEFFNIEKKNGSRKQIVHIKEKKKKRKTREQSTEPQTHPTLSHLEWRVLIHIIDFNKPALSPVGPASL